MSKIFVTVKMNNEHKKYATKRYYVWNRKQQLLTNPTVDVWKIHVTMNLILMSK